MNYSESFVWLIAILASAHGLVAGYLLGWACQHNKSVNRRRAFWNRLASPSRK